MSRYLWAIRLVFHIFGGLLVAAAIAIALTMPAPAFNERYHDHAHVLCPLPLLFGDAERPGRGRHCRVGPAPQHREAVDPCGIVQRANGLDHRRPLATFERLPHVRQHCHRIGRRTAADLGITSRASASSSASAFDRVRSTA
jgi:hypothetical protein